WLESFVRWEGSLVGLSLGPRQPRRPPSADEASTGNRGAEIERKESSVFRDRLKRAEAKRRAPDATAGKCESARRAPRRSLIFIVRRLVDLHRHVIALPCHPSGRGKRRVHETTHCRQEALRQESVRRLARARRRRHNFLFVERSGNGGSPRYRSP